MDATTTIQFEAMLIEVVESYPLLYDKGHLLFKNNVKKELAWAEIAKKVKSDEENCKRVWKRAREHFTRERRGAASGAATTTTWPNFGLMSYMIQYVQTRKRVSNVAEYEDTEESQESQESQQSQKSQQSHLLSMDNSEYRHEYTIDLEDFEPILETDKTTMQCCGDFEDEEAEPQIQPQVQPSTSRALVQKRKYSRESSQEKTRSLAAKRSRQEPPQPKPWQGEIAAALTQLTSAAKVDCNDAIGNMVASYLRRENREPVKTKKEKLITKILFASEEEVDAMLAINF